MSSLSQPLSTSVYNHTINIYDLKKDIQTSIDECLETLKSWRGELFLVVLLDGATKVERLNIMQYIGGRTTLHLMYCCPKKYNNFMGFKGEGWELLKRTYEGPHGNLDTLSLSMVLRQVTRQPDNLCVEMVNHLVVRETQIVAIWI